MNSPATTATSPSDWLRDRNLLRQGKRPGALSEKLYRVKEAAATIGCCCATIRRWGRRGLVEIIRSGPHGWGRIRESEVRRMRGELRRELRRQGKLKK